MGSVLFDFICIRYMDKRLYKNEASQMSSVRVNYLMENDPHCTAPKMIKIMIEPIKNKRTKIQGFTLQIRGFLTVLVYKLFRKTKQKETILKDFV